ncbi:PQQ-binding-like beta-propeller repeat protein [Halorubellus sp. JP-L1]|uniref:outer membrane protein assembly factor BamB family protein n=1 Tax=Halorubellus sp. JP-L1 TaxID=2715753 RepID=UPI00140D791A|nr:PQQ-binding-like beta-propeller repeat protein [Halorubellus sp. JP-L1]NHN43038.1 PQQ-binding-like beta-propeller repeat protein [Halorubellus sp. JP-L1]
MPSRRSFLATASLVLAGCTTGPATTSTGTDGEPSTRPATTPPGSRTTDDRGSGTDDGETTDRDDRTPPSGDAVAWTLDVGAPVATTPVLDPDADVLYAAAGSFERGERPRDASDDQAARDVVAASTDDGAEPWRYAATADVVDLMPAAGGAYAAVGWPTWPEGTDFRVEKLSGGERAWRSAGDRKELSLVGTTAEGGVLAGTHDDGLNVGGETLFAHDADGRERWSVESGDAFGGAVVDGRAYLSFADRLTRCVDVASGETVWEAPGGILAGYDDPRVYGDAIYVEDDVGDGPTHVVAHDATDGSERWRYTATPEDSTFVPVDAVEANGLVHVAEFGGFHVALDAATGTERWRGALGSDVADGPVIVDDLVVYAGEGGGLVAFDAATGERQWRTRLDARATRVVAHAGGLTANLRDDRGATLVRYGLDGTRTWTFEHAADVTQFVAGDDGRAYLGTDDGYLVALAT